MIKLCFQKGDEYGKYLLNRSPGGLIVIILHLLSHGTRHTLFAMGIMDYMANGIKMKWNIVLPATVQAINSS